MSDWISVDEGLPETFPGIRAKRYIIYSTYGNKTATAKYSKTNGWHDKTDKFGYRFVTHWMALPEPPTEVRIDRQVRVPSEPPGRTANRRAAKELRVLAKVVKKHSKRPVPPKGE